MRMYAKALLMAALALSGRGADAQDRPVLAPMRDVAVTYIFTGQTATNAPAQMRVTYADANQRVRIDMFAFPRAAIPFSSIIFDAPGNHIYTLLPAAGSYYVLPATGRKNPGLLLNDTMEYTRSGSATIAGIACTDWTIASHGTPEGTACVSEDGIALRATRLKSPETMEASQVDYGKSSPSLFVPDPDLKLKPNTLPERRAPAK